MTEYHVPVMLRECIEGLNIKPDGTYVDVTYGGGGHAKAILNALGERGQLLVFDQDADAVKNRVDDRRLFFCNANFKYLKHFCHYYGVERIDGLLADLGVSSHQLNEGERGFSYRFGSAELDMRMDEHTGLTAKEVLNTYPQPDLARILRVFGELKKAGPLAKAICSFRQGRPIQTVDDLEEAVQARIDPRNRNKELAQLYQAVRIEVNGEMDALAQMLEQAVELLVPNGRLVVMSYHSLEDRMVKNLIQSGNVHGERITDEFGNWAQKLKAVERKPIMATDEEVAANKRARSAKLRIAEKIDG